MTSYNSFDGTPCTSSNWLLKKILKDEWGFKGFIISDIEGTGGANVLHFTAKDYSESTKQAIEGGFDVFFQTSHSHYPLFYEAFEKGMIDEKAINEAVHRVLRAKFKLGLFEKLYVDTNVTEKWNGSQEHINIAKKVAQEFIVILKNDNKTLPISKQTKLIDNIGLDATKARLGGYSGPGNKVGKTCEINYAVGCGITSEKFKVVPTKNLYCFSEGKKQPGLKGEYFNDSKFEGELVLTRIELKIYFRWILFSLEHKKINYDWYSTRFTRKLIAPETGNFNIGLKGDDGYKLYINDELIINNLKKQSFQEITEKYSFEKYKVYDIKVEFYKSFGNVRFKLIWNTGVENPWKTKIKGVVTASRQSDVAVVVVGIEDGEFRYQAYLSLPGHQEELIGQITATGKPVVVLLVDGNTITMTNRIHKAPAIMDVWFPRDEGDNTVADVLFGDYNPAGRLPITFPIHEAKVPWYYNYKPTGRDDDYSNLTRKPLFPFGYGMSYSTLVYSDLVLNSNEITSA